MRRRAAVSYSRAFAITTGHYSEGESAPRTRITGAALRKSKVRIRRRKPEPLIFEEYMK